MSAITGGRSDRASCWQASLQQRSLHVGCAVACGEQVLATAQHAMCEPVCRVTVHLRAVIR